MKLYDRFLRHGAAVAPYNGDEPPDTRATTSLLAELAPGIRGATLVDVQNVFDVFCGNDIDFAHANGMIPPWPCMWMEWEQGTGSLADDRALFVYTSKIEELLKVDGYDGPRWRVLVLSFGYSEDGGWAPRVLGPMTITETWLDAGGALCMPTNLGMLDVLKTGMPNITDDPVYWDQMAKSNLALVLLTSQFANCRNIETLEVLPTRQQRRAAERRGEPIHKHYVLAIDAATQRKVYPTYGQHRSTDKRLHICRGHFATYTEAAPLFGKLTGRFWIPMHTRGSADTGSVRKDYRIKAPS